MTKREKIEQFLSCKNFAITGVSRTEEKFGNAVYKELTNKGMKLFAVNPKAVSPSNIEFFTSFDKIPVPVDGIISAVPRVESMNIAFDAIRHGIRNIWFQQGTASKEALDFCKQNKINAVSGECILMFTEPVKSIHKFHRTIKKMFGRYPK